MSVGIKLSRKRRLYLSAVKTLPSTGYPRGPVDAKLFRHYGVLIVNEVRSGKVRSHFLAFLLYIFNIMVDKTTPANTDREVGTATQDNMFLMKSVFAGQNV